MTYFVAKGSGVCALSLSRSVGFVHLDRVFVSEHASARVECEMCQGGCEVCQYPRMWSFGSSCLC